MASFDANGTTNKEVGLTYSGVDARDSSGKEVGTADGEGGGGAAVVVRENPKLVRTNP